MMSFLTRSFLGLVGSLCVAAAVALPGAAQEPGEPDLCFNACHAGAMVFYSAGDEEGASEYFDECMEDVCND